MTTRRSLRGLDGVNFFIAAMQAGFGVFVTVYLVHNHWGPKAIGLALTIGTMTSLLSHIPAGALIDRMPDRRLAVWLGVIGLGLAALLLALSASRPIVYTVHILQGLASSLIGPGIASISLASVGHAAFGERVGRNARFASIGNGLTAGAIGLAGSYFQPVSMFWITAALTVPALLSLSLIERLTAEPPGMETAAHGDSKLSWEGLKGLILDRRLLVFAVCILLFFTASAALLPSVAARVTRGRPEYATLIMAVTILLPQAIVATISPWIGRSAESRGRRPILLVAWGLLPIQGVLYATLPGPYALVICQVLGGFSGAMFGVIMTVVTSDLTRETGRFNLILGTLGVAMSIGASASTLFAGIVAAEFGGRVAYLGLALAGLLGLFLLWVGMPETRPGQEQPSPLMSTKIAGSTG